MFQCCYCGLPVHVAKDSHKILLLLFKNPQASHCFLSLHQCLGLHWRLLCVLVRLLWGIAQSCHGPHAARDAAAVCRVELWKLWLQESMLVPLAHCWEGSCQSPACCWQSFELGQLAGVLDRQYFCRRRVGGLLPVVVQTNAHAIFLFSWVELHVPHFIGLWKGRVEGEHPGAAEEMWVSLSWALVQILCIYYRAGVQRMRCGAGFPSVSWNLQCNTYVFYLCTSEPVWGVLLAATHRECVERDLNVWRGSSVYCRDLSSVLFQVQGRAAPVYLSLVQRNFLGLGVFLALQKNKSSPCFLWTILWFFYSKE